MNMLEVQELVFVMNECQTFQTRNNMGDIVRIQEPSLHLRKLHSIWNSLGRMKQPAWFAAENISRDNLE